MNALENYSSQQIQTCEGGPHPVIEGALYPIESVSVLRHKRPTFPIGQGKTADTHGLQTKDSAVKGRNFDLCADEDGSQDNIAGAHSRDGSIRKDERVGSKIPLFHTSPDIQSQTDGQGFGGSSKEGIPVGSEWSIADKEETGNTRRQGEGISWRNAPFDSVSRPRPLNCLQIAEEFDDVGTNQANSENSFADFCYSPNHSRNYAERKFELTGKPFGLLVSPFGLLLSGFDLAEVAA